MQDITHHAFLSILHRRGDADAYVTEYFRVYPGSRLDREILRSIEENPTGRPVVGQLIGMDVEALVRSARALEEHGAAGVDLNLGCPAPIVYRKGAGGGLLRFPERIDAILTALRDAVRGPLTVKTRVGFDAATEFPALLEVFGRHALDGLVVHGRTVRDGYRTPVDVAAIRMAVEEMPFPVVANGSAVSVATAMALWRQTGAQGVMVGRGAIRNPWIFRQLKELREDASRSPYQPTWRDVFAYVEELWDATCVLGSSESRQVRAMKRYMNFIAEGVDPEGSFLHDIRRAETVDGFWELCRRWLDRDGGPEDEPPVGAGSFRGFEALL